MLKKTGAKVSIEDKGETRQVTVDKNTFVIGRATTADLQIESKYLSRHQVRVTIVDESVWVEDLGTSNGTWLRGKELEPNKKVLLEHNEILSLGSKTGPFLKIEALSGAHVLEIPALPVMPRELKKAVGENYSSPISKEKLAIAPSPSKNPSEKKILDEIMNFMNLGADEVRQTALLEAKRIKQKAHEEAVKEAEQYFKEAKQKTKHAEEVLSLKLEGMQVLENETNEKLESLKVQHDELEQSLAELKDTEEKYHTEILELKASIQLEMEAFEQESARFTNDRNEYVEMKRKIEVNCKDLELEERRVKAQIEVDTLEFKAKIAQLHSEVQNAQNFKDQLGPEVLELKRQRDQVDLELNDLQKSRRQLEQELENFQKEIRLASHSLDLLRREHEMTLKEIERGRQSLERFEAELNLRDKTSREKFETARDEAQKLLDDAHITSTAMTSTAQAEFNSLKLQASEVYKKITAAQEESKLQIARAHNESEEIKNLALQDANNIIEEARKESLIHKEKAQGELDDLSQQIIVRHDEFQVNLSRLEAKRKLVEDEIDRIENEYHKRLSEIEKESQDAVHQAKLDATQLKEKLSLSIQEDNHKKKAEADAQLANVLASHQKAKEQSELEHKQNLKKMQTDLAEMKQTEIHHLKELRRKAEEEILKNKHEKSKSVAIDIYAMVSNELYKSRNKTIDATFIESFGEDLKAMVMDIMLDRVGADSDKLQELLKTKEDAKGKERAYWKKVGFISAGVAFVVLIFIAFPSLIAVPKGALISAFSEKESVQADAYVQMKIEEAKKRMEFNPPTTEDYKASYADNVLYTTEFAAKKQSKVFEDKWILELNDYFINQLDVKDTTIIKFVSLEASLIKDLVKMKGSVDPSQSEVKIQEMRDREIEFRNKLKEIFADETKVSQYYAFAEKFWNDFHKTKI